jgi:glycosyltransferase involved in cell wall biosynthesis
MHVAIVDPASFVLPYDCFLAEGLLNVGHEVSLYCSHTAYNESLVDQLSSQHPSRLQVSRRRVSRTRSSSRWRGVLEYGQMVFNLVMRRQRFDRVIVQFGIFLPLDVLLLLALGKRAALTMHDDVPHGHKGRRHWPTWLRAWTARQIVFPSEAVRARFSLRYASRSLDARSVVMQHGTIAATLEAANRPLVEPPPGAAAVTFFGTVKAYKGVEALVDFAALRPGERVEIHGRWDADLAPLRQRAIDTGVHVRDEYISEANLDRLLRECRIFVLPYHAASQSGVLYLLLHYAQPFVATVSGDLGDFLRREGLADLILHSHDPSELATRIDWAKGHLADIRAKLLGIRERYLWTRIVRESPLFR